MADPPGSIEPPVPLTEPPAQAPGADLQTPARTGTWQRIREHKILQWALGYLGAALALAHGADLLGHTFHWPEITQRLILGVLIVGLPLVLTVAWYHGHKGLKSVGHGELMIAAILVVIGAGLLYVLVRTPSEQEGEQKAQALGRTLPDTVKPTRPVNEPQPTSTKPRVAILPFENLSPDPNNAFFADGLHEEILTALANGTRGLEVISRTTMMLYRAAPKPVAQISKELGATYVLEGSVRREGNEVRLTLQLIDAKRDDNIWSRNYDRKLLKAVTLQSEVAREVAAQLSAQLVGPPGGSNPPTNDTQAYDLYLKAKVAFRDLNAQSSQEAFRKTEALLSQALTRDPNFVLAHVERAQLALSRFALGMDQSEANKQSIRADIDVARQLVPADANVMAARAQYLADVGQDLPGALALFDEAELAGLREAATLDGKGKSFVLTRMGRIDEAIAALKRQIALDPGNGNLYHDWSANSRAALRPLEAMRVIDLEMAQERPGGLTFAGYRADTLFAYTGDIGPWRASLPNITGQTDDDFFLGIEAQHMGPEGQIAEFERLLALAPRKAVRPGPFCGFPLFGVGQRPVAEYRGWAKLLAGDKEGAARASREVFAYIASESEARRKDWFLTLLSGTAYVFAGDHAKGQAAASAALSLIPASRDALNRRYAAYLAARVYAWSGAADPSVALLEELATKVPGVGPATIVRDPLFNTPLKDDPRYQTLKIKLEAQMAVTKLK